MARLGMVSQGNAGMESRGEASRGTATQVRRVRVRCGMARQCRLGVAWKGRVRSDLAMQVNFLTGESYGI